MKAIILAAGVGRRLRSVLPKTLLEFGNGESFISNILSNLYSQGLREIICVVGYKKELIMEKYPNLLYVYNPKFAFTNTGFSLYMALAAIEPDDLLIINGDVYFEKASWFSKLINMEGNVIAVKRASCGEEEVKVLLDDEGKVWEISKTIPPERAYGEAIGIYKISKQYFRELQEFTLQLGEEEFYEEAFSLMIKRGISFSLLDVGDSFCIEVDFPKDFDVLKREL